MFCYLQKSGRFFRPGWTAAEAFETVGYAGHSTQPWPLKPGQTILAGEGRNIPSMENVEKIGPLPRGMYTIGEPYHHPVLGPYTMNLTPDVGNKMYNRSAFRIHGDKASAPGTASEGCIVLNHSDRIYVAAAREGKVDSVLKLYEVFKDNRLEVLEG